MYDTFTDDIYIEIHHARLADARFKQIVKDIKEKHGVSVTDKICNERYLAWCDIKHITPKKRLRAPPVPKNYLVREVKISAFEKKKGSHLHLLDLVRAHGELVTNRLTGEVVSGGYPNIQIPDIGTPRVISPFVHGSLVGSSMAVCAESGR